MKKQDRPLAAIPSWNPTWAVQAHEGRLYVSAGADRVYLVDELNEEQVSRFHEAYQQNRWESLHQQSDYLPVLKNLITLGALYYPGSPRKTLKVALQWAGDARTEFAEWFGLLCQRRGDIEIIAAPSPDIDLVLLVRTNSTLQHASDMVSDEKAPHILVDLAYHSTLALGPFVVPGQTACVGCLAGRLMHLWGDVAPPEKPAMNTHIELVGAVLMEHLEAFRSRGTINALVGYTWALDTSTWETRFHPVFRLPWCPVCEQERQENETGSLQTIF